MIGSHGSDAISIVAEQSGLMYSGQDVDKEMHASVLLITPTFDPWKLQHTTHHGSSLEGTQASTGRRMFFFPRSCFAVFSFLFMLFLSLSSHIILSFYHVSFLVILSILLDSTKTLNKSLNLYIHPSIYPSTHQSISMNNVFFF